jgi:hypothetical protein
MRPPRFRLRALMIAVAVAGLLFGLCRVIGDLYGSGRLAGVLGLLVIAPILYLVMSLFFSLIAAGTEWTLRWMRAGSKRSSETNSYARYPWLPISPDPPEPE